MPWPRVRLSPASYRRRSHHAGDAVLGAATVAAAGLTKLPAALLDPNVVINRHLRHHQSSGYARPSTRSGDAGPPYPVIVLSGEQGSAG
jgi:hypothetical protein